MKRCGFVAIVGRPNVGKSTFLNHILKQKISITSRKPQTTRHRILGIDTRNQCQVIYVDTPGLHRKESRAINRFMNRAAASSIQDVNIIVFIVDAMIWTEDDQLVLEKLQHLACPVILAINKVDKITNKEALLPFLQEVSTKMNFSEILPISALKDINLDTIEKMIIKTMPEGAFHFPEDYVTDRSARFMAAELIREKIVRSLGDEIPYSITVEIEKYQVNDKNILEISAVILVERAGQKSIVIGKQGKRLKQIGHDARLDIEKLVEQKIFLQLWVKVKDGWADDERALKSLGYDE